jgi:hypothetical protein
MDHTLREPCFLLFTGYSCYPSWAWEDFRGVYATVDDARQVLPSWREEDHNWYQIVDYRTLTLVEEGLLPFKWPIDGISM